LIRKRISNQTLRITAFYIRPQQRTYGNEANKRFCEVQAGHGK
jgi:hypothetical protein